MLALFLTHPVDWLAHDGVGQNILAGAIVAAFTLLWARIKVVPAWRRLHERLDAHDEHHALVEAHLEEIQNALPGAVTYTETERAQPPAPPPAA